METIKSKCNISGCKPVLYYDDMSSPSRACLMLMNLLDLDIDLCYVDMWLGEHYTDNYLKINPARTLPTLVHDDLILTDSHTILMYFCDNFPSKYCKLLLPPCLRKRLMVLNKLFYERSVLYRRHSELLTDIIRHTFEKVDIDYHSRKCLDAYRALDAFLSIDGNNFMAGKHLTIADLAMVSTLSGLDLIFPVSNYKDQYKYLHEWFLRMQKMPEYRYNLEGLDKQREIVEIVGNFECPLTVQRRTQRETRFPGPPRISFSMADFVATKDNIAFDRTPRSRGNSGMESGTTSRSRGNLGMESGTTPRSLSNLGRESGTTPRSRGNSGMESGPTPRSLGNFRTESDTTPRSLDNLVIESGPTPRSLDNVVIESGDFDSHTAFRRASMSTNKSAISNGRSLKNPSEPSIFENKYSYADTLTDTPLNLNGAGSEDPDRDLGGADVTSGEASRWPEQYRSIQRIRNLYQSRRNSPHSRQPNGTHHVVNFYEGGEQSDRQKDDHPEDSEESAKEQQEKSGGGKRLNPVTVLFIKNKKNVPRFDVNAGIKKIKAV